MHPSSSIKLTDYKINSTTTNVYTHTHTHADTLLYTHSCTMKIVSHFSLFAFHYFEFRQPTTQVTPSMKADSKVYLYAIYHKNYYYNHKQECIRTLSMRNRTNVTLNHNVGAPESTLNPWNVSAVFSVVVVVVVCCCMAHCTKLRGNIFIHLVIHSITHTHIRHVKV